MGKGASGALALFLMWVAFACFYVAFHPGGIQINGHAAQNPRDVILWFMQYLAQGSSASEGSANATTTASTTSATQTA